MKTILVVYSLLFASLVLAQTPIVPPIKPGTEPYVPVVRPGNRIPSADAKRCQEEGAKVKMNSPLETHKMKKAEQACLDRLKKKK